MVTNGELRDTVIEQVRVSNLSRHARGIHNELRTITKGELFAVFRDAHGAYLPKELEDFRTFLELILHDGAAPADKEKAAILFEHLVPNDLSTIGHLDVARAATSISLLTAYITRPAASVLNHWGVFEYWVLAGSYVLYLAEKSTRAEAGCNSVFEICEMAAERALVALTDECQTLNHFVQGLPLDDGYVYRARMTILLGAMSAMDLALQIRGKNDERRPIVRNLVITRLKETTFWGESATPFYWMCILLAEQNCNSILAEAIAIRLVKDIASANGESAQGQGAPNPYYSVEEALRLSYGLNPLNVEQFIGHSYSILPLVYFLARRLRRQALSFLWYSITRISLVDYVPNSPSEWFKWKSDEGVLNSQLVKEPQSWTELMNHAKNVPIDSVPKGLAKRPAFLLWYVLVYPHRFTPATAKIIDDAILNSY